MQAAGDAADDRGGRRARIAWCVFDWANSGYPTVIVTFVFAAYFAQAVAPSPTVGTTQWGYALSISGVFIALLSPAVGAVADRGGPRKPWLGGFSAVCMAAAATLWLVRPDPDDVLLGLVIFAIGNGAFEIATVFYNAMLPGLVPERRLGRLSGWGWGLGYLGGLVCLVIALVVFVQPETPPFGLDKQAAENVRIVGPMVAAWYALFALPLFLWTPDRPSSHLPLRDAVALGLGDLMRTFRDIRRHADIARFLAARILYIDGLNTLFAFGGIYAAGTFGMTLDEIIRFGIAMNVTAGLGAAGFAWIDDRIGARPTILIALGGMIALGIPLLLVETKAGFWLLALPLGIFMGPAQAASRSLMARLAPVGKSTEMFGLFALSGKITAFLGPAVLAFTTDAFASQRAGMATVLVFLALGGLILLTVREPARRPAG